MKLSDIGEEALISRLIRDYRIPAAGDGLVIGAGDDAAVLAEGPGGMLTIITTDMLSEHIDYRDDIITSYRLGWKSAAVNISDIAAMGGVPTWTLVSLGFRPDTDIAYVDEFYRGFTDCTGRYGSRVIGGDMNAVIGDNVISVTQMGSVEPDMLIRRSGAKAGDRILITGYIGQSRAGYELLIKHGLDVSLAVHKALIDAHLTPAPRIPEGRSAAGTHLVHAMMDVSDGLGADLPKLCKASGIGAVVQADRILISDDLRRAAADLGIDALNLAVSGGEDFELLMAVSPCDVDAVIEAMLASTGAPVTEIGEFVDGGIELALPDGSRRTLNKGWEHFA